MKAKEVKAALADEDVQTVVNKQIGAAVRAQNFQRIRRQKRPL
jgi:hypothetical protein